MLITSKRRYLSNVFTTFPIDHVAHNLEQFMIEAQPFITEQVKKIDEDTTELTHSAIILKQKSFHQLKSKIFQLTTNGAPPGVLATEIIDFLLEEQ